MQNLRLIAVFLGMTLVSAVVSPLLFWAPKVLGCRINSDPSTFLAYCNSNDFGDFEHGAFWWNLEPTAIKSLQSAEILFLGDSRVQFAFSTSATRSYFRSRHEPYYLAGFTYFENMVFAQRLMDRYKLRPRVLVINSDQTFFQDLLLATPAAILRPKTEKLFWKTFYGYLLKAAFTNVARPVCATAPFLCAQNLLTLWRRRETGDWIWQETFADPAKSNLISAAAPPPAPSDADMTQIEKAADIFLASIGVARECIFLTAVPNSVSMDDPVARRVGDRFGLPVIIPSVDGLGTIDGSHLNAVSAERWSEAFFKDAAPALDGCLSATGG